MTVGRVTTAGRVEDRHTYPTAVVKAATVLATQIMGHTPDDRIPYPRAISALGQKLTWIYA